VEEENVTTILPFIAPLYITYDLEFHLHLICALRKKKMATATRLMMSKNLSYEKRRRVASFWIAARGINTWNSIFM